MKRLVLAALLAASPAIAGEPAPPAGLKVDRILLLMRHGVRPPTKSPPMPPGIASEPWPEWPVKPGYLTSHGAAAVERVAAYDRAAWIAAGLLPRKGCAKVRIVADSDQRTIATGQAYAAAIAPGCSVRIDHKRQDVPDPLFSPINEKAATLDAQAARRAVLDAAGPGGIAGLEAQLKPEFVRLNAILCEGARSACGVAGEPSSLAPPEPGKRPKLAGALDRASTAAQILLLQYAEGKPARQVGWGRASAADVARLSEFHSAEFRLLARPRIIAKANLALLAPLIARALTGAKGPTITMIAGHDTNVASLGGLLDLHWQVPGLARDDPSPGGAIVFQRLRDHAGRAYIRALYRSQTVEQIRTLAPLADGDLYIAELPIAGCRARGIEGLCTEAAFRAALAI